MTPQPETIVHIAFTRDGGEKGAVCLESSYATDKENFHAIVKRRFKGCDFPFEDVASSWVDGAFDVLAEWLGVDGVFEVITVDIARVDKTIRSYLDDEHWFYQYHTGQDERNIVEIPKKIDGDYWAEQIGYEMNDCGVLGFCLCKNGESDATRIINFNYDGTFSDYWDNTEYGVCE